MKSIKILVLIALISFSLQRVELSRKTKTLSSVVDDPSNMPKGKPALVSLRVGGVYKDGTTALVLSAPQIFNPTISLGYDTGFSIFNINWTQAWTSKYLIKSKSGVAGLIPYKNVLGDFTLVNSYGNYAITANVQGTDQSTVKIEVILAGSYWGIDNINAIFAEVNRRKNLGTQAANQAKQTFISACNAYMSDNPTYLAASQTGDAQKTQLTALYTSMTALNDTQVDCQAKLDSADADLLAAQAIVVTKQAARDAIANRMSSTSAQVIQTTAQISALQAGAISSDTVTALKATVDKDNAALTAAATVLKNIFVNSAAAVDKAVTDCQAATQSAIPGDITAIN